MALPADDDAFFEYTQDHPFAPMYPLLAKEIVVNYEIVDGKCLDIGTGNAALSIELTKITDLDITALDIEPEVVEMAKNNCVQHGVSSNRIRFVTSPVENIPLPDNSMDLIVSRGSIPFWDDATTAFKEIYRVLAPNGVAMIGCGFSHFQSLEEVKEMRPVWSPDVMEERTRWKKGNCLQDTLRQAGIDPFTIIEDGYGTWAEIRKSRKN